MKLRNIVLTKIVLLVLALAISTGAAETNLTISSTANQGFTTNNTSFDNQDVIAEDIEDYHGPIGPGNALYGLKLAFENLDESFTYNESERIAKKLTHAELRIAEAKAELKKKNNAFAEKALEQYREKIKDIEVSVSELRDRDSGFAHSQEMIAKHEKVLQRLRDSNPDNKGLERAFNNSRELQNRFAERIALIEAEETLEIKAEIIGNDSQVEVILKFVSDNATNFTIAEEIHDKLQFTTENITALIKIEEEGEGKLMEKMEAEAEVDINNSKVVFEYQFPLEDMTNITEISQGIRSKLSNLTIDNISAVMEMKVTAERKDVKETEKEMKGEIKEPKIEEKEMKEKIKEPKIEEKRENEGGKKAIK